MGSEELATGGQRGEQAGEKRHDSTRSNLASDINATQPKLAWRNWQTARRIRVGGAGSGELSEWGAQKVPLWERQMLCGVGRGSGSFEDWGGGGGRGK